MSSKIQVAATLLFLASAGLARLLVFTMHSWTFICVVISFFVGFLVVICLGLGTIYFFLASQRVSKHHTVFSALFHFLIMNYVIYVGRRQLKDFRKSLVNPRHAQESRLKNIVTINKDTAYGVAFKFEEIRDLTDFKKKHPLTTYDHYETFVQRVAKGETNVMTSKPVNRLVLTSGTTGKGKWIPRHTSELTIYHGMAAALHLEWFPHVQPMQKIFRLHCNTKLVKSKGGIPIGAGLVVERDTAKFMPMFSTPPDGFMIETIDEAFYVHFLFALRERLLGSAMAMYITMFVDGFKFLEKHWPEMVKDLANGTINKDLNLPPYIRASLEKAIGSGDVQRAEEVMKECERGQIGIMKRLWPFMEYVSVVDNVGIRSTVMKTIGDGLNFHARLYASSEALIGVNFDLLNKGDEEYVMAVNDCIYEFIAEDDVDKPAPETCFIDEVDVGKNYEVVVSQIRGLYRYRFGDVVQVTGYYESTPKVKFMYRTATLLNLFAEKVDQPLVATSLNTALSHWPELKVLHYCVTESTLLTGMAEYDGGAKNGAHYVFFVEMEPTQNEDPSMLLNASDLAKEIDDTIYASHSLFKKFKDSKQIDKSVLYFVQTGTFNKLKDFVLKNSSASELQFKMPQKLRTREMAKIMLMNRIQKITAATEMK